VKHLIWIFLHILDGLQDSQGLLNIPAEGQVVDGCMLDNTLHMRKEAHIYEQSPYAAFYGMK